MIIEQQSDDIAASTIATIWHPSVRGVAKRSVPQSESMTWPVTGCTPTPIATCSLMAAHQEAAPYVKAGDPSNDLSAKPCSLSRLHGIAASS